MGLQAWALCPHPLWQMQLQPGARPAEDAAPRLGVPGPCGP
uniref:Tripeptidyl peptidase 1 n=1 Tax=Homo sapiens TaxID=9606 RepID=A0A2R8Y6T9_HUMAN